jgi:hypothetical protein
MNAKTGYFKAFPEFSRLTLADKEAYTQFIRDLPPVDNMSFSSLMTWWNPLDNMSVAELNGNLVVPYWLAGTEKHSGLCLIGTNKVDESITAIFDYQKARGDKPRLVNVPGFVIGNIQYPELFTFKEEKRYTEYVYRLSRFYPLHNMPFYWRRKVRRRLEQVGDKTVVRSLDLRNHENARLLLSATDEWAPKGVNDFGKVEADCLRIFLDNPRALDIQNMCLFVEGKLHGFCLYTASIDKRYVAVKHIKATDTLSLGFEYMAYQFAQYINEDGAQFVNLNTDQGLMHLRMFMLAIGPHSFFHKYVVEPRQ